jgi:AcrR family transcriptional regulator
MDRRIARTRRALHDALMSLVLRKGYEAITIQDILDEADVGRSTFYSHYAGKDELLRDGFRALRTELGAAQDRKSSGSGPLGFSLALFEHASHYRRTYRALVGSKGSTIVLHEIRRVLTDLVRRESSARSEGRLPADLRVRFAVGALLTVLTWWLEKSPGLAPKEVDAMFHELVTGGGFRQLTEDKYECRQS